MDVRRIINKIKNKIMGLLDKKKKKELEKQKQLEKEIKEQENINFLRTQLNPNEIQYLIGLIAKSDFKGTDLQTVFSITAKLQTQLNQTK